MGMTVQEIKKEKETKRDGERERDRKRESTEEEESKQFRSFPDDSDSIWGTEKLFLCSIGIVALGVLNPLGIQGTILWNTKEKKAPI